MAAKRAWAAEPGFFGFSLTQSRKDGSSCLARRAEVFDLDVVGILGLHFWPVIVEHGARADEEWD
ncbi:hypothetical protein DX908_13220 [Parvularcula marina]|uniref:Uncharacterized protein n=1 Tax=Parvularcula marina TaxID=2292771 RepID=A0A371RL12_9PROT|nr:hypothetical protein DX908_13220 [Parvularcula marina]